MSKELPQSKQSEEVDLLLIFKLIGDAFNKVFNFISSIFKYAFSIIISVIKVIIDNFKLIAAVVVIAAAIGYGLERFKKPVYVSDMLVKPYFDSKYQLVTNIRYYNALIEDKDYEQLKTLFKIDESASKSLVEFEINPGPETENDRILQYDRFVKQVDSIRAQDISYREYLDNRSEYSGDIFQISVLSHKKDVFRLLESGLNSTFTNTYSVKKMEKRDSLLGLDKERVLKSLMQVDSLKRVYIKVMQNESTSNSSKVSIREGGMSMVQERVKTREFELLDKELSLRRELTKIESQQVEEDVYFDTISSFQDVGSIYSNIYSRYSLLFPIASLFMLSVIFLGYRLVLFIQEYEK